MSSSTQNSKKPSIHAEGLDEWDLDYSETGVVIGLEIHVQLTALKTKLFCSCSADYRGAEPNTHTCPVCMGLPGSLPVINEKAIELATTLATAVNANVSPRQFFHRKNYYYPDMSRNFQISQYNRGGGVPFADGGEITIKTKSGKLKTIHLDRMHLEDDPGKLVHKGALATSPYTLVDYNRCGTTLIEIVTKPEMYRPEEARAFLTKLRTIIAHIGISDPNLDGAFRVDANVSLENGNRTEIKNIGSIRDVEKALRWEILRHKQARKQGKEVKRETRAWNGRATVLLRTKEQEDDYRYFPEPDLVPFTVSDEKIRKIHASLPELPDARMKRFIIEYALSEYDADVLVSEKTTADFFEECAKKIKDYKKIVNWLNNDIQGYLNDDNIPITDTKLTPELLIELIELVDKGTLSIKIAKKLVPDILKGESPKTLVKKKGLEKISDRKVLEPLCKEIIKKHPEIVASIEKKPKAFMALVGKVMKETKGKADSELTQKIFAELINFDLSLLKN